MRYYIQFVHHPLGRNIYKQYIITNELPSVNYYSNIYNAFELKCINDEVSYRAVKLLVQNNDSISFKNSEKKKLTIKLIKTSNYLTRKI